MKPQSYSAIRKQIQLVADRCYDDFCAPVSPFLRQAIDLVLPPRCAFSGQIVSGQGDILPEEWAKLEFISDPQCAVCGHPFEFAMESEMVCGLCLKDPPEYKQARAPLIYQDQSRDLILRFKHADHTYALDTFMPWLLRAGEQLLNKADIIIPVPLHYRRLLKRRYNQAGLIAQKLSKRTGIPWAHDILCRARATPTQGHMKTEERKKNVKGAFRVPEKNQDVIRDKTILLIDDVYTTGATVRECARTLLKNGASDINILCLAKVVKR